VEEVFRTYQPSATGVTFAQGLSPFSIVCEGHLEMDAVKKATKQAKLAESGTSLSLADAQTIVATDIRFPTDPQTAAEKLYGWSVVIDVFHGIAHDISRAVRSFVQEVGPALHRLATHSGSLDVGMDLVCRVLYEAQQDYFQYTTRLANGGNPMCPTFACIVDLVITFRAESLSPLPDVWYLLASAPQSSRRAALSATTGRASTSRDRAGAAPVFNTHADRRLLQRFRDSGHTSIGSLIQGHDITVPKHRGKDACLTWAFKGECGPNCKRADNHVRYPQSVNTELGKLLTQCGVADPQP